MKLGEASHRVNTLAHAFYSWGSVNKQLQEYLTLYMQFACLTSYAQGDPGLSSAIISLPFGCA
jgi:hypothetical protein